MISNILQKVAALTFIYSTSNILREHNCYFLCKFISKSNKVFNTRRPLYKTHGMDIIVFNVQNTLIITKYLILNIAQ